MTNNQKDEVLAEYTGPIIKSPMKAIRQYCLQCCMESAHEVKACTAHDCILFPYRYGANPHSKRVMTEEQKQAARDRMAKAREAIND